MFGKSGGVTVGWDLHIFNVMTQDVGELAVRVLLKNRWDATQWHFSGVYVRVMMKQEEILST